MTESTQTSEHRGRYDVYAFFALACAITWAFDFPFALALVQHRSPPDYALPLAGLGAFGPTIAAVIMAARRGEVRRIFSRWRTNPAWILLGLALPFLFHLLATSIEVALGGQPAHWFYPPNKPEFVAGLIFFSVGEEFGWRGFAYERIVRLHGRVVGAAILGAVWGLWHLAMMFTPEKGAPAVQDLLIGMLDLTLWSVVFAWVFERGDRSMWVALALHAGGHLDNVNRAPESEVRLRILRFVIVAIAAAFAARALSKKDAQAAINP